MPKVTGPYSDHVFEVHSSSVAAWEKAGYKAEKPAKKAAAKKAPAKKGSKK